MKPLWWLCLLLLSWLPQADTVHQHSYVGSHGMVLFAAADTLLASHLPLYRPPHDYQLVYQVTLPDVAQQQVLAALRDGQQLTLLPENFDLKQMITGATFALRGDIYQGHFERNGQQWLSQVSVSFSHQLYKRPLQHLSAMPASATYATITVQGQYFLLHSIGSAPSFDQILQVSELPATLQLPVTNGVDAIQQLQAQGITVQQLYLETQDFQP